MRQPSGSHGRKPQDPTQPYRQRHLITIEMDYLAAEVYAAAKLRRLQEERPGALAENSPALTDCAVMSSV